MSPEEPPAFRLPLLPQVLMAAGELLLLQLYLQGAFYEKISGLQKKTCDHVHDGEATILKLEQLTD